MVSLLGLDGLIFALFLSGFSAIISLVGARMNKARLIESARNGTYLACTFTTLASISLFVALLTRDFRVEYVASHTSSDLPLAYTIAAFWAGQEGSLLFWAWILSICAVVVLLQNRNKLNPFLSYVNSIMMFTQFFFLLLLVAVDDPFRLLSHPPLEGLGLNPLLQNPEMIFHPPTLLLGYVGFTVPFAFAMAALLTGQLGTEWLIRTRRWTLFGWFFLGLGTLLGAQWAYVELGWGGYWAWDPVENASLMPWLVATAYLHSVMIQEKRGMLKVWNLALIMLTFLLCIFGTFLTRSGIISSVHTFASAPLLGTLFLVFMGLVILCSGGLLLFRLNFLRSENVLDSLTSKESSFLINNFIFIGMTFAIFWGTMYPAFSELMGGQSITLGPQFFNRVIVPIGLALTVLIGLCPLLAWKRTSLQTVKKQFLIPCGLFIIAALILILLNVRNVYALLSFALSTFVISIIITEFIRGTRARKRMTNESPLTAFGRLMSKNRRRYGGYIVHLGMISIFIGITGSSALNTEKEAVLTKGEWTSVGRYRIHYEEMEYDDTWSKEINTAILSVHVGERQIGFLKPQKNLHRNREQPITEVAIRSTLRDDLYVLLLGWDDDETATFQIHLNPLVMWIWIGGVIFSLGTCIAAWPEREKNIASRKQSSIVKSGLRE